MVQVNINFNQAGSVLAEGLTLSWPKDLNHQPLAFAVSVTRIPNPPVELGPPPHQCDEAWKLDVQGAATPAALTGVIVQASAGAMTNPEFFTSDQPPADPGNKFPQSFYQNMNTTSWIPPNAMTPLHHLPSDPSYLALGV